MNKKSILLFVFVGLLSIGNANAWVSVSDATITEFIQFNEGIGRDYTVIKVTDSASNSILCHIPYAEKNLSSLVLSLYMANKKGIYHCYDDTIDIGGYITHRLHRVIAR